LKNTSTGLLENGIRHPTPGEGRRVQYELLYDGRGREGNPTMCGPVERRETSGTHNTIATTLLHHP